METGIIETGREAERWRAVASRDRAADGCFVYAVTTTRIHCRPSCPSRRPHRAHIRFFESSAAAVAAGFRPCLRCRPDRPAGDADRSAARIAAACRAIAASETPPHLGALAAGAGMTPWHFHRVFKAATGVTPRDYASAERARRVREALGTRGARVTDAIYDAGFVSSGRFYAAADGMLGMRPSQYRDGGAGAEIRFAIGASALGAILVAASGRGICAIALGDDPDMLARELQDRFPRATLVGADPAFEAMVATVIAFVAQPARGLDLPLDLRGTAFQHRVWRALRDIPAGATVSYATLAARIGAPGAVRAVAGACAANTLAVAIPCHRVVRTDGAISGYRWGVARKRALLALESGQSCETV